MRRLSSMFNKKEEPPENSVSPSPNSTTTATAPSIKNDSPSLYNAAAAPAPTADISQTIPDIEAYTNAVCVEIEENQRLDERGTSQSWSHLNLSPADPKRYDSPLGQTDDFPEIPPTDGWIYVCPWEVDRSMSDFDDQGWVYSTSFLDLDLGHYSKFSSATVVRRKRWVRKMIPDPAAPDMSLRMADIGVTRTPEGSQHSGSQLGSAYNLNNITPTGSVRGLPQGDGADDTMTDLGTFDMDYEDDDSASVRGGDFDAETSSQYGGSDMGGSQVSHNSGKLSPKPKKGFFSGWGSSISTRSTSPKPNRTGMGSGVGTPRVTKRPPYVTNPALKISDPTLAELGKQVRLMETASRKEEEAAKQEWIALQKPKLEMQIAELTKRMAEVQKKIEIEAEKGNSDFDKLDEEMKLFTDKCDDRKRQLYFPDSLIALGQEGVYLAVDDLWVEHISGNFRVDIVPDKLRPQINVQLVGDRSGALGHSEKSCGLTLRLKAEKFKLRGDRGMGVPPLAFDSIKITVAVNVAIQITFDVSTSKWLMEKKHFKLEIISFKGPYGINRSMVGAILALVNPLIRKAIVEALPPELGFLLRSLPSPFCAHGEFDVKGVHLQMLSDPLHECTALLEMSRYNPVQLDMFFQLQKSMGMSRVLKSLADLIEYKRTFSKNPTRWEQICFFWEQAAASYCFQLVTAASMDETASPGGTTPGLLGSLKDIKVFNFQTLVNAGDEIGKKRLVTNFKLRYIDGQVSLNHILSFVHQLMYRLTHEKWTKAKSIVESARLNNILEGLGINNDASMEIMRLITKNLDFAQLTIMTGIHAGPEGVINVKVRDILIQAPMFLKLNLFQELNVGSLPLVPYIVSIRPKDNGDLFIEIFHFTHNAKLTADDNADTDGERSHSKSSTENTTISAMKAGREAALGGVVPPSSHFANKHKGSYNISAFNNAVSAITTSKSVPVAKSAAGTDSTEDDSGSVSSKESSRVGVGAAAKGRRMSEAFSLTEEGHGTTQGLRSDEKARAITEALTDLPEGETADSIIVVAATRPNVSMIVDTACTLKPGAELFSLAIGPQEKDWLPFGTGNKYSEEAGVSLGHSDSDKPDVSTEAAERIAENERKHQEFSKGMKTNAAVALHAAAAAAKRAVAAAEKAKLPPPPGCPIAMQTAPGIKMLIQVPKADVTINLAGLLRFVLSHFEDLQLLKEFLDTLLGFPFYVHHLQLVKDIIDKVAKYLVLPGLDIDVNINGKIVTLNSEIMIRVETPEDFLLNPEYDLDNASSVGGSVSGGRERNQHVNRQTEAPSAVTLRAELNLADLMNDIVDIGGYLKTAVDFDEQLLYEQTLATDQEKNSNGKA